ncbi:MAG: hypothetical protein Aurels2KO_06760 [Aureliella sp.]
MLRKRDLTTQTYLVNQQRVGILSKQSLQQSLDELPSDLVGEAGARVRQLGQLVDGDLPLQSFLERLLPELTELLHGEAAVIWMRAEGASGAVFGVRYKMDAIVDSIAGQKKHERLVQLAWQQKQALLAEPASRARKPLSEETASGHQPADSENPPQATRDGATTNQRQAQSANATGRCILFAPVLHLGEPIALIEIVLDASHSELRREKRHLYLQGAQLIAERIYGGLKRRMTLPAATMSRAHEELSAITDEVNALQQQILLQIERRLQSMKGWAFESLKENQAFAKSVHQLLDSHGLRVICPECGSPAILRCLRAGNAKHGAFAFDHYLDTGRTFHGGSTTVPMLRVVKKPARRAALSNPA